MTAARLVRIVLALYPARTRERYGAEIAELLAHSPRPGRDLLDVAWCALTDRGATMPSPRLRSTAWLLAAPLAFVAALAALAGATAMALNIMTSQVADVAFAVSVLPVVAGAAWAARRYAGDRATAPPVLAVPAALAIGIAATAAIPSVGEAFGETWPAVLAAALCWAIATTVVAAAGRILARRARIGAARTVLVLGGLAAVQGACIAYVLLVHRSYGLPVSSAFVAYPAVISGVGAAGELAEALKALPALLTVCTSYALARVYPLGRRAERAAGAQPVISGG
jgi:hypothetical protein